MSRSADPPAAAEDAAPACARAAAAADAAAGFVPTTPGRVVRVLGIPLLVGRDDPGRRYWLTQALVWLWYANAVTVLLLGVGRVRPGHVAFVWALVEAGFGLLTTTILRERYRRWFAGGRALAQAPAAGVLLACVLGGAYWALAAWGVDAMLEGLVVGPVTLSPLVSLPRLAAAGPVLRAVADTLVLVVWSVGYLAAEARREAREARARAAEAAAALEAARFEALRYQVNPHFLFNALTSLQALVAEDAARAERMVGELAAYLRYTLLPADAPGGSAIGAAAPAALVPLAEELAALRAYLAVEQTRFGERLDVRVDVAAAADAVPVPPLLLQPLVENAIRHGPRPGDARLRVRIEGRVVAGTLHLEVANTGALAAPGAGAPRGGAPGAPGVSPPGAGIGLRNVRARLALAFPGRHEFTLAEERGWVVARLAVAPAPAVGGRPPGGAPPNGVPPNGSVPGSTAPGASGPGGRLPNGDVTGGRAAPAEAAP